MSTPLVTRTEREKCWIARDNLFECLDKNESCTELRDLLFRSCPQSWANHFLEKRKNDTAKKALIEKYNAKDINQAIKDGDILLKKE